MAWNPSPEVQVARDARRVVILQKRESGRTWPAWAIADPDGVTRYAWLAATKRRGPWRTRPASLPRGVVVDSVASTPTAAAFAAAWEAAPEGTPRVR